MRALILNCTLKSSPATSNTEAPSSGPTRCSRRPTTPAGRSPTTASPVYLESDHKKDWSASTGRAMAQNLYTVAEALQAGGGVMRAPPG